MREEVKNWWEQAKHDMDVSEHNLRGKMLDAAAFYCQQSVEKALKGYILHTKKESPGPIHSLIKLGRIAGTPRRFDAFLKALSPEYYLSRYPDATEDAPFMSYEESGVRNLIKDAKEFMAWISTRMKE